MKDEEKAEEQLMNELAELRQRITELEASETERKRAEEALQQAEEKYRGIFENAVVGIYQTTIDGDYLTANPTLARILGYESPKELMATVTDVEHQFYVEPGRRAEFIRPVQEQGTVSGFESQVYRKDGSVIWVSETGRSLRDANGRVMGFEGTTVDITERKQVEEEISHRSKQLALINEVGQRIAPILELNELYQTVVEAVQEKFGYQYVAIFLVRDQEVALEAIAGLQTKSIPSGYTQRIGEGMVGWVAKHGQTLLANDVTKEARFLPLEFLDIAAELDVPIRLGGKTIGVLTVDSDRPDTFTEADVTTLETIADQVARAIENARLYEEIQARSAYLETLLQINATLRSTLPLSQVLEIIVQGTAEALGYVGSFITVPDATGERLTLAAAWGGQIVDAFLRVARIKLESFSVPLKIQENLIARAFVTGELQASSGEPEGMAVGAEPSISAKMARAIERIAGARGAACVPLRVAEKTVGVLIIVSPRQQLADEERAMLLGLADQAGLAIENARLYEELRRELTERKRAEDEMRRRSEELAALNAIAATVSGSLDLDEILKSALEKVLEITGFEAGGFGFVDEAREVIVPMVHRGVPQHFLATFAQPKAGDGLRWQSVKAGEAIFFENLPHDPRVRGREALIKGFRAGAYLPLQVKDKSIGLMGLGTGHDHHFSPEEKSLLMTIASQIAMAIENAQAYQRLKTLNLETISALAAAVEAKDPYTSGHSEKVTQFAIAIAGKMGLSTDEIEDLRVAALLHDIGKIGIPDSVLNKPARLTSAEFLMIKAHPVIAAEIVGKIEALAHLVPIIRHHHERWDGTGYPDGLKGKEIPLGARILAVADGFEAMTSERPYRRARTEEEALEELQKGAGTQWDPQMVEVFVKIYEEGALEHQASDQ